MGTMSVQDHTAYKKARKIADVVWKVSRGWDKLTLATIGNQLIRSADSISANLSEGWNRYTKRDKINFFIIARASVAETSDWIGKAYERELIQPHEYLAIQHLLFSLPKEINGLIKGTNQNLKN